MSFSLSEYTKNDVGWGFAICPKPHLGNYSASPAALNKAAAGRNGGEGLAEGGEKGRGREREREGEEGSIGKEGKLRFGC